MDPQVCFYRIMSAMARDDREEFASAFRDLGQWLERGGYPPRVNSLGLDERGQPRLVLNGRGTPYMICSVDPLDAMSGFELLAYHTTGAARGRYPLAREVA